MVDCFMLYVPIRGANETIHLLMLGKYFPVFLLLLVGGFVNPLSIFGFLEFSSFVYVRHSLTVRVALHL